MSPASYSLQTIGLSTDFGPARLLVAGPADGPVILLLHGYAALADQWRPLIDRLADRYRLLAPDLLGFGWAPAPPPPYRLERWVDQMGQLLASLSTPRLVIVGHSLGGLIAVEVCRRWPQRMAALALLDPLGLPVASLDWLLTSRCGWLVDGLRHSALAEGLFAIVRQQRRWLAHPFARSAFHAPLTAPMSAVGEWQQLVERPDSERALLDILRRIERLTTELTPGELTLPSLLIWGCQDRLLPVSQAAAWQDRLPQAELLLINHCGHLPHVEQTALVAAALERLIFSGKLL